MYKFMAYSQACGTRALWHVHKSLLYVCGIYSMRNMLLDNPSWQQGPSMKTCMLGWNGMPVVQNSKACFNCTRADVHCGDCQALAQTSLWCQQTWRDPQSSGNGYACSCFTHVLCMHDACITHACGMHVSCMHVVRMRVLCMLVLYIIFACLCYACVTCLCIVTRLFACCWVMWTSS